MMIEAMNRTTLYMYVIAVITTSFGIVNSKDEVLVRSCPSDKPSWDTAARRKECKPEDGQDYEYHCVKNERQELVETCMVAQWIEKELFQGGMWEKVRKTAETHNLSSLVPELECTIMSARERSTVDNFSSYWTKWCDWCQRLNISPMLANQENIALYLVSIYQTVSSAATIRQTFYALQWGFNVNGVPLNPCKNEWIKLCLDALMRKSDTRKNRKEPMTVEMLENYVRTYASDTATLMDLSFAIMCILGFAGFFRFSELVDIRRSDIVFFESYMTIFVFKSKTDVYRDGSWVVIAKTNNSCCPYALLKRYLSCANTLDSDSDEFIFRSVLYSKNKECYKLKVRPDVHISYTRNVHFYY